MEIKHLTQQEMREILGDGVVIFGSMRPDSLKTNSQALKKGKAKKKKPPSISTGLKRRKASSKNSGSRQPPVDSATIDEANVTHALNVGAVSGAITTTDEDQEDDYWMDEGTGDEQDQFDKWRDSRGPLYLKELANNLAGLARSKLEKKSKLKKR